MGSLQWVADTINGILKHGWSLSALLISLTALFRVRKVRKKIGKIFPALADDDSEIKEYVTNQARIESKVDALMSAGGVSWHVDSQTGKTAQNVTTGQQKRSLLQRAAYALATFTNAFTRLVVIYPSQQRRMNMRSKLLSRKLWMTILGSMVLVLNQQLGWHLNTESIIGIGSLIMSFIFGQSLVDTNGVGQFAPFLEKIKSSKLWVSLIGSALIIINDEYKLGFTADHIYMLVGIGVTFILGKSTASVVQASKSAEVNNEKPYSDTDHAV